MPKTLAKELDERPPAEPDRTPKQKEDMDAVTNAYQAYTEGAKEHVFDKLEASGRAEVTPQVKALFGDRNVHLQTLFSTLNLISTDPYGLNTNAGRMTKIQHFFQSLQGLPKPACYCIPANDLSKGLTDLFLNISDENFENYLTCSQHIFDTDVFSGIEPLNQTPEDIKKLGLLYKTIGTISSTLAIFG